MGIAPGECYKSGRFSGRKWSLTSSYAYLDLIDVMDQMKSEGANPSATLRTDSSHPDLCPVRFSNFASIGSRLVESARWRQSAAEISLNFGLRAMLGGMIACCMTACVAGVLYGVL